MQKNSFIHIGRTKKAHGTEGELKVHLFEEFTEDFLNTEFVFLDIDGGKVPFAVENIRFTGSPLVHFEDIDSSDEAVKYTAKQMYLQLADVLKTEERSIPQDLNDTSRYRRYTGYKIVDLTEGEIGKIEEVIEMPQQEMAQVTFRGKELLIPLHDTLIEDIDAKGSMIVMDLPEGLLEL